MAIKLYLKQRWLCGLGGKGAKTKYKRTDSKLLQNEKTVNGNILILLRDEPQPFEAGREQGDNRRKCVSQTKEQTAGEKSSGKKHLEGVREERLIPLNPTGGSTGAIWTPWQLQPGLKRGSWGRRTKEKFTVHSSCQSGGNCFEVNSKRW